MHQLLRNKGYKIWAGIILLGGLLCGPGCGREAPKPAKVPMPPIGKKEAAPPEKPSPAPVEVKPEAPKEVAYYYDPKGKVDPFKPLIVEKKEVAAPGQVQKKKIDVSSQGNTPLEKLVVGELKLVAIIWNIRDFRGNLMPPKALIEGPEGKGYIVTHGTAVGKFQGKVTNISATRVIVTEKYYDEPSDKVKTRDVPLKLYPDE